MKVSQFWLEVANIDKWMRRITELRNYLLNLFV